MEVKLVARPEIGETCRHHGPIRTYPDDELEGELTITNDLKFAVARTRTYARPLPCHSSPLIVHTQDIRARSNSTDEDGSRVDYAENKVVSVGFTS